jgi:hypothetical protein
MKGKYLRRFGGLILTALLLVTGVAFFSPSEAQAQTRQVQGRRRVVIVRPYPYWRHRPWAYRSWWGSPYGWGYDPWSPYGSYYRRYVFDNSEEAAGQAYKDGFNTGKDDGKKAKSYDPQRSHYFKESGFGNFAEVYRSGFSRGYEEGYEVGQGERAQKQREKALKERNG